MTSFADLLECGKIQVGCRPVLDIQTSTVEEIIFKLRGKLPEPEDVQKIQSDFCDYVCQLVRQKKLPQGPVVSVSPGDNGWQLENGFCPLKRLTAAVKEAGLEDGQIQLELSEKILLALPESSHKFLKTYSKTKLRLSLVCREAIVTSLRLLSAVSISSVKISCLSLRGGSSGLRENKILESIVRGCSELGLKVVATGVEKEKHIEILKKIGCRFAAGDYFSGLVTIPQLQDIFSEEDDLVYLR